MSAPQPRAEEITRLQDLARPGLKLVLAQATVPVGNYARQSLAKMAGDADFGADFSQRVLTNLVSEEGNVRQVVSKVLLGEADAGIGPIRGCSPWDGHYSSAGDRGRDLAGMLGVAHIWFLGLDHQRW